MTIQQGFLVLILGVLVCTVGLLLFYELGSKKWKQWETISAYWNKFDRNRRWAMILMGLALTALYVFLMGDLSFEWW